MGEIPPPEKEHLLVIVPYPEPKDIIEGIKKRHPNVSIYYKTLETFSPKPHGPESDDLAGLYLIHLKLTY
jgi:hypothetical protein